MTLTVKQFEWDIFKAMNPPIRSRDRGVTTTVTRRRKHIRCTCPHTMKHHRKRGGCRGQCPCRAGVR